MIKQSGKLLTSYSEYGIWSIKSIALLDYYTIERLHIQYKYSKTEDTCNMIDYKAIGAQIRRIRLKCGMTQEQLAEAAGVCVTHISHIETGNSIPSLQVLIDIINSLDCSADDLLFMEINQDCPQRFNWLCELTADCSPEEVKLISDTVLSLKSSLRRLKTLEKP